jgi:hypothetical protein
MVIQRRIKGREERLKSQENSMKEPRLHLYYSRGVDVIHKNIAMLYQNSISCSSTFAYPSFPA